MTVSSPRRGRNRFAVVSIAALSAVAALVGTAQAEQYALQKTNSISLSSQFFGGATPSAYGVNPLSVTFDGTNAYVGGYNNSGAAGTTGVVRIDNAISAAPAFTPLTGNGAIVPTPSFRGIDHLASFGGDVLMAQTTGGTGSAPSSFIRRVTGTTGTTVWNTNGPLGLQPFAMAIDPLADNNTPAVGFISQDDFNGGARFAIKLSDGSALGNAAGVFSTSGRDIGFSPRDMAFDSQGNLASITGRGVGYARRTGTDSFVNDITGTGGGAGSAGVLAHQPPDVNNNGNAVAILEGAGTTNFLATSIRVSGLNDLVLTQFDGTVQTTVDARDVQIRNLNGSLAGISQAQLNGSEDFLGNFYNGQIKGFATGKDANNNPVLFVVDFISNVLDVFQVEPTWKGTSGGTWDTAANWQIGLVANGATQNARFGQSASAQTVTLNSARTTKLLKLDSTNAYAINGTGTLTLDAPAGAASNVSVTQGNHSIGVAITVAKDVNFRIAASSSLTVSSQVAADGRGITKLGAGTLNMLNVRASALALNEGSVVVTANGGGSGVSRVGTLGLNGGTINLTNNTLVVDYLPTDATPFAALKAAVIDPAGAIRSSLVIPGGTTALAIVEASTVNLATVGLPAGVAADATSVIIRYTLKGDADIDKTVAFSDLVRLAQNYNLASGAEWNQGDFNYDGAVGFSDLVSLAQNYNQTVSLEALESFGADFAADWALAQSLVPEPTSLMAAAGAGLLMSRRRR